MLHFTYGDAIAFTVGCLITHLFIGWISDDWDERLVAVLYQLAGIWGLVVMAAFNR